MTHSNFTMFETEGLFYKADIKIDIILSHPWLVEKTLGVIPHLKALTALDLELAILQGNVPPPPTEHDQEEESTFWVDHVLAKKLYDH